MIKDNDVIKRALVSLAIEQTLIEIGNATYEKVARNLFEKYHVIFLIVMIIQNI